MSRHLLLTPSPGLDWEVWTLPAAAGKPTLGETTSDPGEAVHSAAKVTVALPVGQCLTLPLWLTGAGPGLFEPMILAQLEKRGYASRNGVAPVFDFAKVAVLENRTLVRVTLLIGNLPESLCFAKARGYTGLANLLPLPESQLVIWQERQNLVLAVARGGEVVYTQILSRSYQITAETALELRSIRLALEAEQIVESIAGITAWGSFPEGLECLQLLKLPVDHDERPAPNPERLTALGSSGLVPLPVQRARALQSRRSRSLRYMAMAAVIYVVLVLLLAAHLRKLQAQAIALGEEVKRDKPAAAELEQTAAAWRVVESAVDPEHFAIEQFYRCSEALPPVGVRFSNFEIKGRSVHIKGNARSVQELFKYVEALKQAPVISRGSWKAGQPKVFQDNTVEFRIEGTLR